MLSYMLRVASRARTRSRLLPFASVASRAIVSSEVAPFRRISSRAGSFVANRSASQSRTISSPAARMPAVCADAADDCGEMNYDIGSHIVIHSYDVRDFDEVIVLDFWDKDIFTSAFLETFEEVAAEATGVEPLVALAARLASMNRCGLHQLLARHGASAEEFRRASPGSVAAEQKGSPDDGKARPS